MKPVWVFLVSLLLNKGAFAFLWDKEVEVIQSEWAPFAVVVRHVEYIGVTDNGTLDCTVPGFRKYEWRLFSKSAEGLYTESSELVTRLRIGKHQSRVNIGNGGFNLNSDVMVAICTPLLDHRPRLQIIWVITRLHSPLGYPTDPRVCDFSAKDLSRNCQWYKLHYNTECYYGKGEDYRGHENFLSGESDEECMHWEAVARDPREGVIANAIKSILEEKKIGLEAQHNYCRNALSKTRFKPWCVNNKSFSFTYCKILECSDCMYGNGFGLFPLYPQRLFPVYRGRSVVVVGKNSKNEHMMCVKGETCAPSSLFRSKPSCTVKKENGDKERMACRIPQCTVRLVWFLFFDSFGRAYVEQSNFEAVEIMLVEGQRETRIRFGAFGIHLASGLSVGTEDGKLVGFVKHFQLIRQTPPRGLSTLIVKKVNKKLNGIYYVQYFFKEVDSEVGQQGSYRAKFKLSVKPPMHLALRPTLLKVCRGQPGFLRLNISGAFDVLEESIRWKYGPSSDELTTDIPFGHKIFKLSEDFRSLAVTKVTESVVVGVEGRAFSGKTRATARIEIKGE